MILVIKVFYFWVSDWIFSDIFPYDVDSTTIIVLYYSITSCFTISGYGTFDTISIYW